MEGDHSCPSQSPAPHPQPPQAGADRSAGRVCGRHGPGPRMHLGPLALQVEASSWGQPVPVLTRASESGLAASLYRDVWARAGMYGPGPGCVGPGQDV